MAVPTTWLWRRSGAAPPDGRVDGGGLEGRRHRRHRRAVALEAIRTQRGCANKSYVEQEHRRCCPCWLLHAHSSQPCIWICNCMHTKERVSPRSTRASRTDVQIEGKGAGAGTPVGRYFVQLYSSQLQLYVKRVRQGRRCVVSISPLTKHKYIGRDDVSELLWVGPCLGGTALLAAARIPSSNLRAY